MRWNATVPSIALVTCLTVVGAPWIYAQTPPQNTAARALFLEGRDFWDDGKFADAERKFREALTKYPKADQSDRTAYYLITTLIKLGRSADARTEIENFTRNYPQSTWRSDVEESRIRLIGHPFIATPGLRLTVQAPPIQDALTASDDTKQRVLNLRGPLVAGGIFAPVNVAVGNPSLESEILRLIVEKNPDRGIEVARERLRMDPSDPAVISNLGAISNSNSVQALPFLVKVAGTSASPNVSTQAIFWISYVNGDRDAVGKVLVDMLMNSKDKETDAAVTDAFTRLNVVERRAAIDKFVDSKNPERLVLLEKIYRITPNAQLRMQMAQSAAQIPAPKALAFLTEVARNDKDLTVRRAAIQAMAGRKDADAVKELEDLLKSFPPAEPKK